MACRDAPCGKIAARSVVMCHRRCRTQVAALREFRVGAKVQFTVWEDGGVCAEAEASLRKKRLYPAGGISEVEAGEVLFLFFPAVVDCAVDIVQEGFSRLKGDERFFRQVRREDEVVVQALYEAEVPEFEELRIRAVRRESLRGLLQGIGRVHHKSGGQSVQDPPEVAAAQEDVLPQDFQHAGFGEIVPDGQQMVTVSVDVEVVPAVPGLLPAPVYENAHMRLIRTLVFGEPYVAVDSVGAVQCGQGADGVVEGADSLDEFHRQFADSGLRLQIVGLVGFEPDLVVVQGKGMEISQDLFHGIMDLCSRCSARIRRAKITINI